MENNTIINKQQHKSKQCVPCTHNCTPAVAHLCIIWPPHRPCGMDGTALVHFHIGNMNFPGPKGPAQCHATGLSEDQNTWPPASGFFLLLLSNPLPTSGPICTPVTRHSVGKRAHLVFIAVPSCGLLSPARLPQELSLQTVVPKVFAPTCSKRRVCQKIGCLKHPLCPRNTTAQIRVWFTATPTSWQLLG